MNLKQAARYTDNADEQVEKYIYDHSDREPKWCAKTYRETHLQMINPRMASSPLQGRILSMLSKMISPSNILEIGTYTGYSAMCLAEGLTSEGYIDTYEIDDELEDFIREQLLNSPYTHQIKLHIGDALKLIPSQDTIYDLAFIDGDKRYYQEFYDCILPKIRTGGFILADNTMWDGKVLIDKPANNDYQTIAIKAFNETIAVDQRIEKIILPLRDGLTLIRKR